jgi:hypothetical protein
MKKKRKQILTNEAISHSASSSSHLLFLPMPPPIPQVVDGSPFKT